LLIMERGELKIILYLLLLNDFIVFFGAKNTVCYYSLG